MQVRHAITDLIPAKAQVETLTAATGRATDKRTQLLTAIEAAGDALEAANAACNDAEAKYADNEASIVDLEVKLQNAKRA